MSCNAANLAQPCPRSAGLRTTLTILGVALLLFWAVWWWQSVQAGRLLGIGRTWIPPFPQQNPILWMDHLHSHLAVNHWLNGGNPYLEQFGDPNAVTYAYPPIVLALFAWTGGVELVPGAVLWTLITALILALGTWLAVRVRRRLKLIDVPYPLALALVLLSMPVLFMMERGNSDVLAVLMIAIATWALRGKAWWHDVIVGLCIAVAAWVKIYPGVAAFGLIVLRRPRACAMSFVGMVLIGLIPYDLTRDWVHSALTGVGSHQLPPPSTYTHSIAGHWPYIARAIGLDALASPRLGMVVAAVLLAPLALWVSWPMLSRRANAIAYPYLLWAAQLGSFALPASYYDYKLIFLPLAAVAVWDRRDARWVHLLMLPFLLVWQPIALPIDPWVLFAFKLMGLAAVGAMIRSRALAQPRREPAAERQAPAAA